MNFHPSMAGIETEKRKYSRAPVLRFLTIDETRVALEMRADKKSWESIASALGVTRFQVQKSLAHKPTPVKRRPPDMLDPDDPGVTDKGFDTSRNARACDDLLDALHRHHVMPKTDAKTERPRFMRVIRPNFSYCGSPGQMCIEGRASCGGKTKTHEGAR